MDSPQAFDVATLPLFCYEPLSEEPSFRLLQIVEASQDAIRVTLRPFSLSEPPKYVALSYTWGAPRPAEPSSADPNWPMGCDSIVRSSPQGPAERDRLIVCNGGRLGVTENLRQALLALYPTDQPLWIDAVSINQGDLEERSAQVSLMGPIYSRANHVVVWLGPADSTSSMAFNFVKDVAPGIARLAEPQSTAHAEYYGVAAADVATRHRVFWRLMERAEMTGDEAHAVKTLFQRSWFERVWVFQEVVLAKDLRLRCGTDLLDWADLTLFSSYVFANFQPACHLHPITRQLGSEVFDPTPAIAPGLMDTVRTSFQQAANPVDITKKFSRTVTEPSSAQQAFCIFLEQAICFSRARKASLPCDMIFAPASLALHLFSGHIEPVFFVPDYQKPIEDLYTDTAGIIINYSQSLRLLAQVTTGMKRDLDNLPSWVPEFDIHGSVSLELLCIYDALCTSKLECNVNVCGRILRTSGIVLDTIASTGPPGSHSRDTTFATSLNELLHFALSLDEPYPIGSESSLDAFHRTVLGDIFKDHGQTQRRILFRLYVLLSCVMNKDVYGMILDAVSRLGPHGYLATVLPDFIAGAESSGLRAALDGLQAGHADIAPTFAEVVTMFKEVCVAGNDLYEGHNAIFMKTLDQAFLKAIVQRRLFKSQKGYVGTTPRTSQEGDEIWLVPGRKVPLVFRKDQTDGSHRYLGDAYVHGIMHGEQEFHAEDLQPLTIK